MARKYTKIGLWDKLKFVRIRKYLTMLITKIRVAKLALLNLLIKLIASIDYVLLNTRNIIKYRFLAKSSASGIIVPVFVVLAGLIAFGKLSWFYEWQWIGVALKNIRIPEDPSQLFFGIGATTGSMLAIVFAFSSQLISRSAEVYSSRYFRVFARDVKIDLSYMLVGVVTVIEFLLGAVVMSSDYKWVTICIRIGAFLLLSSIIVLYFSYIRLIKLMNNEEQVLLLAGTYKKKIDEMSYLSKRIARISYRGKNLVESEKLTRESNAYQQLQPLMNDLMSHLDGLIEVYFISKDKKDTYSAHNYLETAFGIVDAYMMSRQNNALLSYNPAAGLTAESDISKFLQTSLERLNVIWKKALAENDVITIRKYVRHMQGVARISSMVRHFNRPAENPGYYTAMYYFTELVEDSIKIRNVDALFEISDAYTQIVEMALKMEYRVDPIEEILKNLKLICQLSASNNSEMYPVLKNSVDAIINISNQIFTQERLDGRRLRILQKYLPPSLAIGATSNHALVEASIANFGDNIFAYTTSSFADELSKTEIEKVINVSKLALAIIQKLELLAVGIDTGAQSMNRSIVIMTGLLLELLNNEKIREEDKREIKYVVSQISELPNQLPDLKSMKDFADVDDFLDKLLQSSFIAMQADFPDIAEDFLNSIFAYLNNAMTNNSGSINTVDLLRVANKLKLLGATAKILNYDKLSRSIAKFIRDYEKLYHKKQFPKGFGNKASYDMPPQFLRPIEEQDDFLYMGSTGLPSYFNDIYALFYGKYTNEQLAEFDRSVWV